MYRLHVSCYCCLSLLLLLYPPAITRRVLPYLDCQALDFCKPRDNYDSSRCIKNKVDLNWIFLHIDRKLQIQMVYFTFLLAKLIICYYLCCDLYHSIRLLGWNYKRRGPEWTHWSKTRSFCHANRRAAGHRQNSLFFLSWSRAESRRILA